MRTPPGGQIRSPNNGGATTHEHARLGDRETSPLRPSDRDLERFSDTPTIPKNRSATEPITAIVEKKA